jgi:hypothetical protein
MKTGKAGNRRMSDLAIAGNVVAGHRREGRDVLVAAGFQAGDDQPEHGFRFGIGRILRDCRMLRIERPRRRLAHK